MCAAHSRDRSNNLISIDDGEEGATIIIKIKSKYRAFGTNKVHEIRVVEV